MTLQGRKKGWDRFYRVCVLASVLITTADSCRAEMVGWWRFESDALDSSSFSHHGRLVGDATFDHDTPDSAAGGRSLRLGGQGFIRVEHRPELTLETALSIALWVKPAQDEGWHGLVSKAPKWGNWDGAAGNYEFRIEHESRILVFLHQLVVSNASVPYPAETAVIPTGVWSHVTLTVAVINDVVVARFYLNGELMDALAAEIDGPGLPVNENPLYIGSRPDRRTGFNGWLDDLRLFNHTLTSDEIAAIAGGTAPTEVRPLLLADQDQDQIPDWWEWRHTGGLDTILGSDSDTDSDGLSDRQEYELATTYYPELSPIHADTDQDGLSDGQEVLSTAERVPTDPTDPDSDGDGFRDGVESRTGSTLNTLSVNTDPNSPDSDGDGWDDRIELIRRSDPADPDSTPSRGLLGLWRFDDELIRDESLFGNHGHLINGQYASENRPGGSPDGKSLQLSGDGYALIPHDRSLNVRDEITLTAWVKPSGAEGWDSILAKGPSDGSGFNHAGNYEFRIEAGSRLLGFLHQQHWFEDTSPLISLQPSIPNEEWTHVAITASTHETGEVRYYVNGTLVDVFPESIPIETFPINSNDLFIGNRADFFTGFDGLIDDVAIFDRILPLEEIAKVRDGEWEAYEIYPTTTGPALDITHLPQSSEILLSWTDSIPNGAVLEVSYDLAQWEPLIFLEPAAPQTEHRLPTELLHRPAFFRLLID